jgi:hypothetical protein
LKQLEVMMNITLSIVPKKRTVLVLLTVGEYAVLLEVPH